MNVYEEKICEIITENSFVYELCREEWIKLKLTFDFPESFAKFVEYVRLHFYDLICRECAEPVWGLLYEFYKNIDFYEICKYCIDFF